MATSEILTFCPNDTGTNLLTQAEYSADSQRTNGNQPGTASSKLNNKALKQSALVASAMAAWVAELQSTDVTDLLTSAQLKDLFQLAFNEAFTLRLSAAQVVLPGSMMMWPASVAPAGYFKRDGAAISRTTYAALFAIIGTTYGVGNGTTTFNLPDDRAIFERGWDDAKGIDVGRIFGTTQASQNLTHTHTGTANSAGTHTHPIYTLNNLTGNSYGVAFHVNSSTALPDGSSTYSGASGSAGEHTHGLTINSSGGTESRPYNRAYLPIIKF